MIKQVIYRLTNRICDCEKPIWNMMIMAAYPASESRYEIRAKCCGAVFSSRIDSVSAAFEIEQKSQSDNIDKPAPPVVDANLAGLAKRSAG